MSGHIGTKIELNLDRICIQSSSSNKIFNVSLKLGGIGTAVCKGTAGFFGGDIMTI